MEENMAILLADLSGYTALTETHGASAAADTIDKYLEIVKDCLVGDSHLHERTGDEVMILSAFPDHLVATAKKLIQYSSGENNFLQVHGGLHYGKILKRNNSYFGAAINLTARIAGKANPGTFWCSEVYVNALLHKTASTFQPKGKHSFKNVSEENKLFELMTGYPKHFHIDPVCKMLIHEKGKATAHPHESHIFFCHPTCLDIYLANNVN